MTLVQSEVTTETDTQSTQRFELERASETSLSDTLNINAGASISGSYGPVSAQASFGVSSSTARQSSLRESSKFAQEVVSKASQKVRELRSTQEHRTTKVVVDDSTLHSFENKEPGADHIIGIYRWVDKLQKLQLCDYGRRLMLRLTIPEPGSYLRWLERQRTMASGRPQEPTVLLSGKAAPLQPAHLTPENYLGWVAQYGVKDVNPPPARYQTASVGFSVDPSESAEKPGYATKTDTKVIVPGGYRAIAARGAVGGDLATPFFQSPMASTYTMIAIRTMRLFSLQRRKRPTIWVCFTLRSMSHWRGLPLHHRALMSLPPGQACR